MPRRGPVSQQRITARELSTSVLAADHRRVFARGIVVTDPAQRPVGTQTHTVTIPSAQLPAGAMDGYEVPAYLSTVVSFTATTDGAYSVFVTPRLRDGDVPPEPLTLFVSRA